jgi:hypothetical protein
MRDIYDEESTPPDHSNLVPVDIRPTVVATAPCYGCSLVGVMEWTWVGVNYTGALRNYELHVDCDNTALWTAFATHGTVSGWLDPAAPDISYLDLKHIPPYEPLRIPTGWDTACVVVASFFLLICLLLTCVIGRHECYEHRAREALSVNSAGALSDQV